eukprot:NODE_168_length_14557_cov_0.729008.p10 type:complete len:170 gc:universal NODE_168_length_14557_cov_0.729008:6121-5612(-)
MPAQNQSLPISLLASGSVFKGKQILDSTDDWEITLKILELNEKKGTLCGFMTACSTSHNVVTYLEGEIVDFRNYHFKTGKWNATVKEDDKYWNQLKRRGDGVFLRLKEQSFVSGNTEGLTISGFYYCALRNDGSLEGTYMDPQCIPNQKLILKKCSDAYGFSFPSYSFN